MPTAPSPQTGVRAYVGRALGAWMVFALAPLLAVRLRLLHLEALKKTPLFDTLIGDSEHYDAWGQRLAAGDWLSGDAPFYMDPLYPYFLGGLYRLFGHDTALVRSVQVGLSAATVVLVGLLARRLAGPAAGTVAAFAWALFRPDVFNTGELDKTVLGLFLVSAALLAMVKESKKARAAAGALFGLAALTRGNLLAAAPVVALVYLWPERAQWRRPLALLRSHGGQSALAFLGAFALAVSPATARNLAVSGQLVLTTTGLGPTFFTGNSEWSHTGYFELLPFIRPEARFEETDFRLEAERRTGRPLTPSQVSSFWLGEGLRFCAAHPLLTAGRFFKKLWLVGNDVEGTDMIDAAVVARYSPALRLPLFTVAWFVPLALLGMWAGRRSDQVRLVTAWVLALSAALAAFFILARYRVMVMPAVVALATVGGKWLVERAAARDWRRAGAGAAAVAASGALFFYPPGITHKREALGALNIAGVFGAAGQYAEAEALVHWATRLAPEEPGPWCALAEHAAFFQRWAEAKEHAGRCLAADQRHRGAYLVLGRAEEGLGNLDAAREAYRRQLVLIPGEEEAAVRLQALGP